MDRFINRVVLSGERIVPEGDFFRQGADDRFWVLSFGDVARCTQAEALENRFIGVEGCHGDKEWWVGELPTKPSPAATPKSQNKSMIANTGVNATLAIVAGTVLLGVGFVLMRRSNRAWDRPEPRSQRDPREVDHRIGSDSVRHRERPLGERSEDVHAKGVV